MRLRWNVDTVIIQMNCNTLQSLPGALVSSSRVGIWDLVFQVQPAGRPVTHGWSVCLFCCLSALQLRTLFNAFRQTLLTPINGNLLSLHGDVGTVEECPRGFDWNEVQTTSLSGHLVPIIWDIFPVSALPKFNIISVCGQMPLNSNDVYKSPLLCHTCR